MSNPDSSTFRVKWERLIVVILLVACAFAFLWMFWVALDLAIDLNLHGGLPRCTDEIADAKGMCWGEPQ